MKPILQDIGRAFASCVEHIENRASRAIDLNIAVRKSSRRIAGRLEPEAESSPFSRWRLDPCYPRSGQGFPRGVDDTGDGDRSRIGLPRSRQRGRIVRAAKRRRKHGVCFGGVRQTRTSLRFSRTSRSQTARSSRHSSRAASRSDLNRALLSIFLW